MVNDLTSFLSAIYLDVRLIVIYGMGGIGKTTIAKVVFNELYSSFGKHCSFLENVRRSLLTEEGLVKLQKKLLSDIVDSKHAKHIKNSEQGMQRIGATLSSNMVLVVLDDVDDKEHIKKLIGNSSLKLGSRIIIKTRNKNLLQVEDFEGKIRLHEMLELENAPALQLFCWHAFGKDSPSHNYDCFSSRIVSLTGRLPLAIELIGSQLKGKDQKTWVETVTKLEKIPEKKIEETLQISYDDLNEQQQQIFLDIACFFVNEKKTNAIYMWEHCEFYPITGIEVLISRCLIKILDNEKFWMHDQLIDLGREIVRQESPLDHAERSRLRISKKGIEIMKTEKWKDKVQALEIDGWDHPIEIENEELKRLRNLRYLKLGNATFVGDFANCCSNLKWIFWCSPRQDFREENMYLDHLVFLKLDKNDFTDDSEAWDLIKRARNLKVVSLSRCDGTTTIPDFSKSSGLKRLTLTYCNRLKRIESLIGHLRSLIELDIEGCKSLTNLSEEVGALEKLERFSLKGCCMLSKLPSSLGNVTSLIELDLSSTGITGCNLSWIVRLSGLKKLDLNSPSMPALQELAFLSHLEKLTVSERYVKFLKLPPSLTYLQIEKGTSTGGLIHPSLKKVALKVDSHDAREALKIVAKFAGVISVSMDENSKMIMVTGDKEVVIIVNRLRKSFHTDIISIKSIQKREVRLKMRWHDEKDMKKGVDMIFRSAEVDTVVVNMKDQKLTVTGNIDADKLVEKLREERFSVELHN